VKASLSNPKTNKGKLMFFNGKPNFVGVLETCDNIRQDIEEKTYRPVFLRNDLG